MYTADLVIFGRLNFGEFLILDFSRSLEYREFSFFFSSAIIIIIFARSLNSLICPPCEIRENSNLVNITGSTVSGSTSVTISVKGYFLSTVAILTSSVWVNSFILNHWAFRGARAGAMVQWLKCLLGKSEIEPHSGLQISNKQIASPLIRKDSILLRDREVACSASDRQVNFESCVWRAASSHSSYLPQEVLLAQFSQYVHKAGLKTHSFHLICLGALMRL